jgi:Tfp pilus assembly protein PilO
LTAVKETLKKAEAKNALEVVAKNNLEAQVTSLQASVASLTNQLKNAGVIILYDCK